MGDEAQELASLPRAAQKIDWAARALIAAALDLQAIGATSAGGVIGEEADRLESLVGEIRQLAVT